VYLTDIIAEFYASNENDLENMSKVMFASTKTRTNSEILQALIVGAEESFLLQEFKRSDIEIAYKNLGSILLEIQSKLGKPCMLIGDKDDDPIIGYFIFEIIEVTIDVSIVTIGKF